MSEDKKIQTLFDRYGIVQEDGIFLFSQLTARVVAKHDLTVKQAKQAMVLLMSGLLSEMQIALFLTAMSMKEQQASEIAAFATVMREFAASVVTPATKDVWKKVKTVDTCGTGGGSVSTFNISTAVAFVLVAAGLTVAKHGNRAMTSRAGSADVLEALGVDISLAPHDIGACILDTGIGFLFAPAFHQSTRHVQKVRRQLPYRTFFNILGPLTNPTLPRSQVIGVYAPELVMPVARVLVELKVKRAMVVHGLSAKQGQCLDEISLLGTTKVAEISDGKIKQYVFDPRKYGFAYCSARAIAGGSPEDNARILRGILSGKTKGAKRDAVVINAAAGLLVTGKAQGWKSAISLAQALLDSGSPAVKLDDLVHYSQKCSRGKT